VSQESHPGICSILLMVVLLEAGVGEGAGLVPAAGGADAPAPGAALEVEAMGGVVLTEVDCIEAEPPPHPPMDISNEAKTTRVTACGGTRRISQF
jgi:hypothetical protein